MWRIHCVTSSPSPCDEFTVSRVHWLPVKLPQKKRAGKFVQSSITQPRSVRLCWSFLNTCALCVPGGHRLLKSTLDHIQGGRQRPNRTEQSVVKAIDQWQPRLRLSFARVNITTLFNSCLDETLSVSCIYISCFADAVFFWRLRLVYKHYSDDVDKLHYFVANFSGRYMDQIVSKSTEI